ncbi:hypothetical protein A3Q56_08392, partial [Intoshia linei]
MDNLNYDKAKQICLNYEFITEFIKVSLIEKNPQIDRRLCFRCGSPNHLASYFECSARTVKCRKCDKFGHYEKYCNPKLFKHKLKGKNRYTISHLNKKLTVYINDTAVNIVVDTGSEWHTIKQTGSYDGICRYDNEKVKHQFEIVPNSIPILGLDLIKKLQINLNDVFRIINLVQTEPDISNKSTDTCLNSVCKPDDSIIPKYPISNTI